MKYLILVNNYYPFYDPTSKIAHRFLLNCFNDDDCLYVFSFGKNGFVKISNNCTNYQFDEQKLNLFGRLKLFFFKFIRKIFKKIIPPDYWIFNPYFKFVKDYISILKIDRIISFSGSFYTARIANKIYKKFKITFSCFYTDPFLENVNKKQNPSFLKFLETKWLYNTNYLMLPSNYFTCYKEKYPNLENKIKIIELPCFLDDFPEVLESELSPINYICQNGSFYSSIRPIDTLFSFASVLKNQDPKILSLSKKPNTIPKNLSEKIIFEQKIGIDYNIILKSSKYFLIIDNLSGIQIPSKVFELTFLKKPIIFVYFSDTSFTKKYLDNFGFVFSINATDINKFTFASFVNKIKDMDYTIPKYIFDKYSCDNIYETMRKLIRNF